MTQVFNPVEAPDVIHQYLVQVIQRSKKSFVKVGQLLYDLKKSGAYKKAVGDGIDTWDDYISQPEINLSRAEADRLMQIYEQFVLIRGIDRERLSEVPIKNLHYLLPLAKKGGANIEELLDAAATLRQHDFKARVGELQYNGELTYEYMIMRRCIETGSLSKVREIPSDVIVDWMELNINGV